MLFWNYCAVVYLNKEMIFVRIITLFGYQLNFFFISVTISWNNYSSNFWFYYANGTAITGVKQPFFIVTQTDAK